MVTLYPNSYRVAVIGASGNVGSNTLSMLAEKDFPISKIYAVASDRSSGNDINFGNRGILKITGISDFNFKDVDLAFFCAGSEVSKQYVEKAVQNNVTVIDKTSHFRYHPKVPLIVPEVNENILLNGAELGIVSNPNCIVIPLSMTLKALDNVSKIKRVIVSTYQAVSGAGKLANDELKNQIRAIQNNEPFVPKVFAKQIAYNVIPSIDTPRIGGITGEEEKIANEILKIVGKHVKIFITCVRVPVLVGHSMSVIVETENEISPSDAYDVFASFPGIVVKDNLSNNDYATPIDAADQDVVFVSRIRRDVSAKNSIGYWVTADNLRKGASLNGVMIAKSMIKIDPTLSIFKNKN